MLEEYMLSTGFTKQEIEDIVKECLLLGGAQDKLDNRIIERIQLLISYGFNVKDIVRIFAKYPLVCMHTVQYIVDKFNSMVAFGFSKDDVIKVIKYCTKNKFY